MSSYRRTANYVMHGHTRLAVRVAGQEAGIDAMLQRANLTEDALITVRRLVRLPNAPDWAKDWLRRHDHSSPLHEETTL